MKNNIPVFIVIFFLLKINQSLGQTSNKVDATKFDDSQQPIVYREYGVIPLPLESAIDPEKYLLGPGDRLRILWSVENVDNFVTIGPTGNLIIPEIGSVNVLGKTLAEVDREINEEIKQIYKSAKVSVELIRFRQFKVFVYGAVNKPKFVKMAPVSRFYEAINGAGGLQKYADPERSVLIRNGNSKNIFLKEFLLKGDLTNNPQLIDGDKIYVPFLNITPDKQANYMEYDNSNKILVTGFVFRPGAHYFRPGFSVKDYIALSGGSLDVGAVNRVKILKKDGTTTTLVNNNIVEPGDIIEVPETYGSILFGNTGFIQALTSIATLFLAYQATQR
tara:strand:+ start:64 stop:1062 length:999 start_codon:yes stop_codon:yes gene_type:complete